MFTGSSMKKNYVHYALSSLFAYVLLCGLLHARMAENPMVSQQAMPVGMPGVSRSQQPIPMQPMHTLKKKKTKRRAVKKRTQAGKSAVPMSFSSENSPEIDSEIKMLMEDAQQFVDALNLDVQKQEKSLAEATRKKLVEMQETVEERITEVKEEAKTLAQQLQNEMIEEAKKLKRKAALEQLKIVDSVHRKAWELRQEEQRRKIAEKYGISLDEYESVTAEELHADDEVLAGKAEEKHEQKEVKKPKAIMPGFVSEEMKNSMSRIFYNAMSFIKSIILAGESPREKQDYMKRFSEQNLWFDNTLRGTESESDPSYLELMSKQQKLSDLVEAQKIADAYLNNVAESAKLHAHQKSKVRLMVLYDLNALIQQRLIDLDPVKRATKLSKDEIHGVVRRNAGEYSAAFQKLDSKLSGVEIEKGKTIQTVSMMDRKLQAELTSAREKLEQEKKKNMVLIEKSEEERENVMNVQIEAKKLQEQIDHFKKERDKALQLTNEDKKMRSQLIGKVEESSRENMSLQIDLNRTQEVASEMTKKAQKEEALRKEAESRAQMVEQLAQQTIDSINKYLAEERSALAAREAALKQDKDVVKNERKALKAEREEIARERKQLELDKKLLLDQKRLLQNIQQETQKLVQQSLETSSKSRLDSELKLRSLQQQTEKTVKLMRDIRDNTKKELEQARQTFDDIKQEAIKKSTQQASKRLEEIQAQTRQALELKNRAEMRASMSKKRIALGQK